MSEREWLRYANHWTPYYFRMIKASEAIILVDEMNGFR